MTENNAKVVWPAALVICLVLIIGMWAVAYSVNKNTNDKTQASQNLQLPSAAEIASELALRMPAPVSTSSESNASVPGDFSLTKAEFETQATENKALELANISVNSRDFKKAVYNLLANLTVNTNNTVYDLDLESYKDITEVRVKDYQVKDYQVDEYEVEYTVIVYYFTYGDDSNKMKAYLDEFTVIVDNMDFDEDFQDAEVDEDYFGSLVVNKVKEA